MRRRSCGLLVATLLIMLSVSGEEQEDDLGVGLRILQERLAPVEKKGKDAVESSIIREVGFLADVWLGEGDVDYYNGLMDKWEECATEKSLPVLERFIRNAAEIKYVHNDAVLPWGVFAILDERVQRLWVKLKSINMLAIDKAKMAIELLELDNQYRVIINTRIIEEVLMDVGKPARTLVYSYLEKQATIKRRQIHYTMLFDGPFELREENIQKFLGMPDSVGYTLVLKNLRAADDERALEPLLAMVWDDRTVGFAIQELRHWQKYRNRIIPVLVEVANQKQVRQDPRWPDADLERGSLFYALGQMGKDPSTIRVFKKYLANISKPETWRGLSPAALYARRDALDVAIEYLQKWGEWPVKQKAVLVK